MKTTLRRWCFSVCLACVTANQAVGEIVINDGEVAMSRAELEYLVAQWDKQMQLDAANDIGNRMELLNKLLSSKKIAAQAAAMTPEQDGEAYWQKETAVRSMLHRFMVQRYLANLQVPDMSALAQEHYATEKDKYAWLPARRLSSHILVMCPVQGGDCDRQQARARIESIQAELQAGAAFGALAEAHSEDPGSKDKQGRFDKWLQADEPGVDKEYRNALFAIEGEGAYSGIVTSAFGFHIIRLDEEKASYYRPYSEVQAQIEADLVTEYKKQKVRTFNQQYQFSDELSIDGDAMEEIFAPYKTAE
jgi:peptidyl-prolyl cis-trans isomerase C